MTSRSRVAAQVAESKRLHPDQFCPASRCLWRTGGGRCPRHAAPVLLVEYATGVPGHACATCNSAWPVSEGDADPLHHSSTCPDRPAVVR